MLLTEFMLSEGLNVPLFFCNQAFILLRACSLCVLFFEKGERGGGEAGRLPVIVYVVPEFLSVMSPCLPRRASSKPSRLDYPAR